MDQMLKLIIQMLNNSCGQLSQTPLREGGKSEIDEFNGGYQRYHIETHCVRFVINAKPDRTKSLEDPEHWDVRDWHMEDC